MNDIIISQIRQRLEILYQMVDELERSGGGGGEPGTTNYNDLTNKPSVNGHILIGSKTSSDLDLQPVISDLSTIRSGATLGATAVQPSDMENALDDKVDKVEGKGLSTNDFTNEDKEQITTNKDNISLLSMRKVYSTVRNTSTTHTYTMKASDFNGSPAGTYLITIVTWSTTPSFSLYAASYLGNQTTVTNLTKIAGVDANIDITDGVISCTTSGKIQIIALQ